jgi:hypothetical protein
MEITASFQISACFAHEFYSWTVRICLFLVLFSTFDGEAAAFKVIPSLLFRELELEAECFVANSPTSPVTDLGRRAGAGVLPLSSFAFGVFCFRRLLVDSRGFGWRIHLIRPSSKPPEPSKRIGMVCKDSSPLALRIGMPSL